MTTLEQQLEQWAREAHKQGVAAAETAASWTTDGNGDEAAIRRTLEMLEAGDPEAEQYLPAMPNLSGEWADSPTPAGLFADITGLDAHAESSWNYDSYQRALEAICEAWEAGVAETFGPACEAELRKAL